jgi:DNA-binding PadR family transcriptional regulator
MSDAPTEAEAFLPLHPFDFRILLVLAAGPSHGYRIIQAIEARDGSWKRVLPANLYRRLRDLNARDLVREVDAPPDTPHDERGRRTFALTGLGREVALAERRRLEALLLDARNALPEA